MALCGDGFPTAGVGVVIGRVAGDLRPFPCGDRANPKTVGGRVPLEYSVLLSRGAPACFLYSSLSCLVPLRLEM